MIVIIDYGMGNLSSVRKALARIKIPSLVSSSKKDIVAADKLIIPGVGHFGRGMGNLKELGLLEIIHTAVLENKIPVLGICLGMQLMAMRSEEGNISGLGWFDADVVKFQVRDNLKYKVPHMGWNQITKTKESSLLSGVPDLAEFYFLHSYYLQCNEPTDILAETEYESKFTSAVEKENIFGVQFHPEKSHDVGAQLLRNFANM
jgi:glutamine amidotransferase